ncbi:hypothetical protein O3P69_000072 [Scylla paramamosain]|uniref:nicotinamidase n=1 Tax=Scylla paramamosain TaxID=85552 RepID=A0AAW0UUA1_SCYPA
MGVDGPSPVHLSSPLDTWHTPLISTADRSPQYHYLPSHLPPRSPQHHYLCLTTLSPLNARPPLRPHHSHHQEAETRRESHTTTLLRHPTRRLRGKVAAAAAAAAMSLSSPKQPETPVSVSKSSAQHDATPSPSSLTPLAAQTTPGDKVSTIKQGTTRDETKATDGGREEGDTSQSQEQPCDLILECVADMDACFKAFDKDEDGFLNQSEFSALCRALFRNERGKPYPVETSMLNTIFAIFDTNKDHVIDKEEFRYCWQKWIKQVVRPVTALVIVDVQNDFISGSLALYNCPAGHHGEEVIPPINRMLDENRFDVVVYSLDWHPDNHVSFIDNVHMRPLHSSCKLTSEETQVYDTVIFDVNNDGTPMEQKLWPRHCVQNTWGAELHEDLKVAEDAILVYKGTDPDTDSYSVFWDNNKKFHTTLNEELQKRGVTDVFVCGVAYDVCVAATTKHAIEEGYRTILIDDGCRGVSEEDIMITREHITANQGLVVHSSQVKNLATGRDRPPVLAYKLALELSKKTKKK